MKSRIRDFCFTLLGVAGLIVYVLACGPSFSPDGTKVAFPVIDYDAKQTLIVVYDINNETLETVADFTNPNYEGKNTDDDISMVYSVQWIRDGKQLLINGSFWTVMRPLGSEGSTRMLLHKEDMFVVPFTAPPVIGSYQYIGDMDESIIYRINLQNWEIKPVSLDFDSDDMSPLFSDGKDLYCAVEPDKRDQNSYRILRLNGEDGSHSLVAQLDPEECGKMEGFILKLGGDRFAGCSIYQDAAHIILIRGNSVEKRIPIGEEGGRTYIGNLVLSPDGKSIFASVAKRLDDAGKAQYSVMKVPLNGGKTYEMPLFTGNLEKNTDDHLSLQIALSPEGDKIATSSLSPIPELKLKPEDRALYLIDISDPDWKVDKIEVPLNSGSD